MGAQQQHIGALQLPDPLLSCERCSAVVAAQKPKRKSAASRRRMANQIPEDIQNDPELTKAIEQVERYLCWCLLAMAEHR